MLKAIKKCNSINHYNYYKHKDNVCMYTYFKDICNVHFAFFFCYLQHWRLPIMIIKILGKPRVARNNDHLILQYYLMHNGQTWFCIISGNSLWIWTLTLSSFIFNGLIGVFFFIMYFWNDPYRYLKLWTTATVWDCLSAL
jgi:hypothetical protein